MPAIQNAAHSMYPVMCSDEEDLVTLVQQAGGIVWRAAGEGAEVLVVSAKHERSHWIFPKGDVEAGESPAEAAEREVREEAGIDSRVVAPAGDLEFAHEGRHLRVTYFLLELTKRVGEGDGRVVTWRTIDDALEALTFEGSRRLLRSFRRKIEAQARRASRS
ncbi:MAG TPA: NUDIX domain-containing protein [Gemmatimonadaceae bacterium]|nr:NUDIX domain-containing protein [Gemmatimonadaceae bacterium]